MNKKILEKQRELIDHPLYLQLRTVENLRIFMKYHVFAVWDFMSLLKSLQRHLTCVDLPWRPSPYSSKVVQLINEIVVAEESDQDQSGEPVSHFELYLQAMKEVGADTQPMEQFLVDMNLSRLPTELQSVLKFHLDLAINGKAHQVAAGFFYGREDIIPDMFDEAVGQLKKAAIPCHILLYYLNRHIELDGEEHGPKAMQCLKEVTPTPELAEQAEDMALQAIAMRKKLWDFIYSEIQANQTQMSSASV